jgi:hypothetical protein
MDTLAAGPLGLQLVEMVLSNLQLWRVEELDLRCESRIGQSPQSARVELASFG